MIAKLTEEQKARVKEALATYNWLIGERGIYVPHEITLANEVLIETMVRHCPAQASALPAPAAEGPEFAQLAQQVQELATNLAGLGGALAALTARFGELEQALARTPVTVATTASMPSLPFLPPPVLPPAVSAIAPAPAAETPGNTKRRGNGSGR